MLNSFQAGALQVDVYPTAEIMGRAAAAAVAGAIQALAARQETVRIILGSANSQIGFIDALTLDHILPWNRIDCFHLDEYIGLPEDHPASFRRWMTKRVVGRVKPRQFHFLDGDAADPEAEAERYGRLLQERPVDIACLGIGENGHLAFNDPAFADFAEKRTVRIVEPDEASRRQQVGEGHFASIDAVPKRAFTLTIPALLAARQLFCIVPDRRKAAAVRAALEGPVTTACPASILRQQPHARLFLDANAAAELSTNAARLEVVSDRTAPPASAGGGKHAVRDTLVRQGFVPIFVNDRLSSRRLVEGAVNAGCRVLEYSCRRPDAREMIPWIKREFPDAAVLAATLMDGPRVSSHLRGSQPGFLTIDDAAGLGADGLVSFVRFLPETYARHGGRLLMIAGVGTANEGLDQIELGADLIKVTVHSTTGMDLVTKSRVPTHGSLPFFVSGGVTFANVESYIKLGVVATAAGFDMLLGDAGNLEEKEVEPAVRRAIQRMLATIEAAREKHQPRLQEAIRRAENNLLSNGPWYHPPA